MDGKEPVYLKRATMIVRGDIRSVGCRDVVRSRPRKVGIVGMVRNPAPV